MRGALVVISGPSGTGKGTIIKALLEKLPRGILSVSCTTRAMRPGEVEGKDYFFISEEEFVLSLIHICCKRKLFFFRANGALRRSCRDFRYDRPSACITW